MSYITIILVFFLGTITALCSFLSDVISGNPDDGYFSDKTLKKLKLKDESIFRKILPFKENKEYPNNFLYIRVIPLVIHTILFIVSIILFFIDQILWDFLEDEIFFWIGGITAIFFMFYKLITNILSRILNI